MKTANLLRNILLNKDNNFTFYKYKNCEKIFFPREKGLYIHIPFCKNFCPYCPYNKLPYNPKLATSYKEALIKEIQLYAQKLGKTTFNSLYFGGGTPTLMIEQLKEILDKLRSNFIISGPFGIETHPNNVNVLLAKKLKKMGFNLISLGVQSFNQKFLDKIGRNYNVKTAIMACKTLKEQNFETFNIDLMFALEGQQIKHIKKDLQIAISLGADQITCYPLFTFPYSSVGEMKMIKNVKLPNHISRKNMYYFIHDFLEKQGYHRSSVWSFSRINTKAYSSVTRDYYLGFGPGSATYNGTGFYFNTFSLSQYINRINNNHLPVAIKMDVNKKLEKYFWLYWRLYETIIPKKKFAKLFKININDNFKFLIKIMHLLNFIERENEESIILNKRGSHWIHLIQNYYALNYVAKIWSKCMKEPWPEKIKI